MGDRLFLSEYVQGTRSAHVLERLTSKDYVIYCFCCGYELETDSFSTEQEARNWAQDWVEHTVELPELAEMAGPEGCGCAEH